MPTTSLVLAHAALRNAARNGAVWQAKYDQFIMTRTFFEQQRSAHGIAQPILESMNASLFLAGRQGHLPKNIMDEWESEYSCDTEMRVPQQLGDGPKWMCGPAYHRPCTMLSLGSDLDASFERGMHRLANCSTYIVDPTISSAPELVGFVEELAGIGAVLNTSIGVGRHGSKVRLMKERHATPLVGIRELLRERYPGPTRHLSIVKIDIEGAEYDTLRDLYQMCADGELSLDQLLVELHVGPAIKSGSRYDYTLRDLRHAFDGAAKCSLMLHHKERNGWGCDGFLCIEFSWVSTMHARQTLSALIGHEDRHPH